MVFLVKKTHQLWLLMKKILYNKLCNNSQPGSGTAREKFNGFFVCQSFFSSDLLRFWSLRYPGVRGFSWRGHTCVGNLPCVGGEVCAIFGGGWSGGSHMKEGQSVYIDIKTSQPGPSAARDKNFKGLPIRTFYVTQSFFSVTYLGQVILVLRTFPELVGISMQNMVEIGLAVCAWKRVTGIYIGTNSLFYI